ncbi:MAG: ECF transporter S component [Lachnospiraceae bacterium]|nr:ECF transporter S component [Lachnospiraceae bacterium]
MKDKKILKMAQMAILTAIIMIMAFTPLGYFRTAGLEISLITIPVVIGSMIIGPGAGAALGGIFGITSFYQCFGMSPFGATLLSINPLFTLLVCIPTRILMGYLTGIIFKLLMKADRTKTVSYFIGGMIGAFLNTLFFMGMLMLCFFHTDFLQSLNDSMGNLNPIAFVIAFVGINGLFEMIITCFLGGVIAKALSKAIRNM